MSLRRVEIAVRVRTPDCPPDASCISLDAKTRHIHVEDVSGGTTGSSRRSYKEDFIFDEHVSNRAIFDELVLKKMQSTSPERPDTLCFLAYGHTSSGKTYSIAGSDEEPGILRLCVEELLRREGVVEVAMLEVYMDSVNDLLAEGQARQIRRRQGPQGPIIVVEDLTTCSLTAVEQWHAVSAYGMQSRRTAATERNARSSRSHAMFTIKSRSVRLCLVDLAGSERQTVFSPQLNRESISINKSLSRLSTVLEALSSQRVAEDGKRSYVNFRDTTLTVLLQRYLTGASLTTFLACVHPSVRNYQETLSTLRYTQRLKRIRTRGAAAHVEEWSGLKPAANQELLDELMRLREQVRLNESTSKLVEAVQQRRIAELEHTLAAQQQAASISPPSNGAHGGAAVVPHGGPSSLITSSANDRVRDTRRVAGWLLSRVLGELPELNVGYDDYFDRFFPPSVQVIGYVSTMAGLVPRTADADPLAFLDVGDLAMGLSMLDAGIPPFVRLHKAGCADPARWESHEWDAAHSVVYVLAFFEYHPTAMTFLTGEAASEGEVLPCCGGFVVSSPLLPIATVLCVPATASRPVKEDVLQRLIDLQCEQQEAVKEQAGGSAASSSSRSSPLSTSRSDPEHVLPLAAELLDASLLRAAREESGEDGGENAGANVDGSLLAQEVRRQAADTSHLVTPFKESSTTGGSSRSTSSSSSSCCAEDRKPGVADVRRDLLPHFGPTTHRAAKNVPPPLFPPPSALVADEPTVQTGTSLLAAAAAEGRRSRQPFVKVAPPSLPAERSARKKPTKPPPPKSPSSLLAAPPALSKKQRVEKGNGDKTAGANGCQGCHVI
ncbi:putative kinesin [Leptomonas pyrrhocoris]|uniref:Putative kinesin n=1 Tax=Leptomonas pyrrhocoris TaxID=157538 RepID=A0A0M9FYQ6_LEPPY|nr:putative kinesin [Leptomonas pyrrhocoris]KPA78677.1 putative kinesin [Leptomonas pyrrhocoris]|eukprot:XP_015657116.1 putative kinesin [Leptomonas pyrrhocoris]